ncbi:chromatin-modulating protein MRC1 ASCRUDRAFT_28707 [Ascoidea rubescens DSM 1968]|uniref:DNA replication checkpoint mediator MRC1 domain-containing protein n=1 Tax=Ascoidea rubescens DSM 1968 TaxID=1344418 RepID=A0A1D2VRY1_9ASCO|nr:hypothetical protein ASCRUDRAFT_28707 [Ascoidea rubescens DSM 1968]ODV64363.1 hypothetical protein ASCRUDRAFT_28707 [Ascoidea rubescens DSM 1968]
MSEKIKNIFGEDSLLNLAPTQVQYKSYSKKKILDHISENENDSGDKSDNEYEYEVDSTDVPTLDDKISASSKNTKNNKSSVYGVENEVEVEDISDTEDQNELLQKVKLAIKRQAQNELRNKIKKRELAKSGLGDIFEEEAIESDDEWHGIGGADRNDKDDFEMDSEDERMINDSKNINYNHDALKEFYNKENLSNDREYVSKLLNDIKTGKLRSRVNRDGFGRGGIDDLDLELSDDDDDELARFHRMKAERQRRKLLENNEMRNLAKNDKTKAFFESIAEDTNTDSLKIDNGNQPIVKRRRIQITSEFVKKTLSFINNDDLATEEERYLQTEKLSLSQHNFKSQIEMKDEFAKIKERIRQKKLREEEYKRTKVHDIELGNESKKGIHKTRSIIENYKTFLSENKDFASEQITVNKNYKNANTNSASVMFLINKNKN